MQMNFTLILSQSVSKFDMGNCVMFYDVFYEMGRTTAASKGVVL